MARIALGVGTSHTPMLLVDAADLSRYEENDRRLSLIDQDGATASFDILRDRAGSRHAEATTPTAMTGRHDAAGRALAGLAEAVASADLDALVIIGDDQQEMLRGTTMPQLLFYTQPTIRAARPAHPPNRPAWVLRGTDRYYPATPADVPVHNVLARHLLAALRHQGIEAADAETHDAPMGHAFAFVCTQLLRATPVPIVPVLLNALYPPTQPDAAQCLRIGAAIGSAIAAFPGDARVGIVASGGLSHFVVDEPFDRTVVRALADQDEATLAELPEHKMRFGSGEIRNWICAASALRSLRLDRIDYFPGYRTLAGTGTGLCFAIWR